jgi:hypothetical protein
MHYLIYSNPKSKSYLDNNNQEEGKTEEDILAGIEELKN